MYFTLHTIHPSKQLIYKLWHQSCRRCHKNTLFSIDHTFFSMSKTSRFIYQIFRHNCMDSFQFFYIIRIDYAYLCICFVCIFYFLNFFLFAQYKLSISYLLSCHMFRSLLLSASVSYVLLPCHKSI